MMLFYSSHVKQQPYDHLTLLRMYTLIHTTLEEMW